MAVAGALSAAERSCPMSEVRGDGREELPCFGGQGQQPKGATPHLRPGAATGKNNPASKEQWLCRHRRA